MKKASRRFFILLIGGALSIGSLSRGESGVHGFFQATQSAVSQGGRAVLPPDPPEGQKDCSKFKAPKMNDSVEADSRVSCFRVLAKRAISTSCYYNDRVINVFTPGRAFSSHSFSLSSYDDALYFSASWDSRRQICRLNSAYMILDGHRLFELSLEPAHLCYTVREKDGWNRTTWTRVNTADYRLNTE